MDAEPIAALQGLLGSGQPGRIHIDQQHPGASLQQLPWLHASLKEALRLYPPAAIVFTRRACQDVKLGPWTLPKGHLMAFTPYVIHRDARWFESPDAFQPERFLPGARESIERFAYLPFGAGPRVCIGQQFALVEAMMVLASLTRRLRFAYAGSAPPEPVQRITLRPKGGMPMLVTRR
jgi:cytochrome P450